MNKNYSFSFQIWSLFVFLLVMIPTFIWAAIPAPNDILRVASVTPHIDIIASIFQAIMITVLCLLKSKSTNPICISKLIIVSALCCLCYYICWGFYYFGITNAIVIIGLTVPPCLTFLFYAIDRKNYIAIFPTIVFSICHLIFGIVNFIL